jgi:hypothetical protein
MNVTRLRQKTDSRPAAQDPIAWRDSGLAGSGSHGALPTPAAQGRSQHVVLFDGPINGLHLV